VAIESKKCSCIDSDQFGIDSVYDSSLKQQLSELLKVEIDTIELTPIETGLTHRSFRCQISDKLCFVKVYNFAQDAIAQVDRINQLTQFMRRRDIPAPRIIAYSTRTPRIVVHEYVDGSSATGDINELPSIAQLYSRLVSIGLENSTQVGRSDYLQPLHNTQLRLQGLNENALVCGDLHRQYLSLWRRVIDILDKELSSTTLLHLNIHDDFTEKNLLMKYQEVALLCDWDSYRLKYFVEHFSCSIVRFSTEAPLDGDIVKSKLELFYRNLTPDLLQTLSAAKSYPSLLPVLATLKHLRTYGFRNSIVKHRSPDLEQPLLHWPLQHCQSLLENRATISQWLASFH
tara:strand:+ start:128 stop:1159 length:1032 start_codon:yes stop_codon:yes gene_type:complete